MSYQKTKKIRTSVVIVLDVLIFVISRLGVQAAEMLYNSFRNITFSYVNEIHDVFNEDYSNEEYNESYNILFNSISNDINIKEAELPNKSILPPKDYTPANKKEHKDNIKQWENRCSGSNVSEYYRLYASASYDYADYLNNIKDENISDIKKYSKLSIDNYRIYIMYDDVENYQIADALYRIGQATTLLALISENNAEISMLSALYFEIANYYKSNDSRYYNSISFYTAEAFERITYNCNSSNVIMLLSKSEEYYKAAIDDGYKKQDCYSRLSIIYSKFANVIQKYNVNYTVQTYDEYIELSEEYKNK